MMLNNQQAPFLNTAQMEKQLRFLICIQNLPSRDGIALRLKLLPVTS